MVCSSTCMQSVYAVAGNTTYTQSAACVYIRQQVHAARASSRQCVYAVSTLGLLHLDEVSDRFSFSHIEGYCQQSASRASLSHNFLQLRIHHSVSKYTQHSSSNFARTFSTLRAPTTTIAPRRASVSVNDLPIPDEAPVTRQTLPCTENRSSILASRRLNDTRNALRFLIF